MYVRPKIVAIKENLTEFISIQYKFSNCFNHLDIINLNKRYNGGTDFLILDQPTNCWDVCKKEKCLLDVEKVIFCKSEIQKNINDQNIITNINNYNVTLEDFSVLYKNFLNYGDEVGTTSEIREKLIDLNYNKKLNNIDFPGKSNVKGSIKEAILNFGEVQKYHSTNE